MRSELDNKLTSLLNKKFQEFQLEEDETNGFWMDIEKSIPSTGSTLFSLIAKTSIALGIVFLLFYQFSAGYDYTNSTSENTHIQEHTTLATLEDSATGSQDNSTIDSQENTPTEHETDSPVAQSSTPRSNETSLHDKGDDNVIVKPLDDQPIEEIPSNKSTSVTREEVLPPSQPSDAFTQPEEAFEINVEFQPKEIAYKKVVLLHDEMIPSMTMDSISVSTPIVKTTNYLYGFSSLSFHTLNPNALDEFLVGPDNAQRESFADRLSVGIGYGKVRHLNTKIKLRTSGGLTYTRATLYFRNNSNAMSKQGMANNQVTLDFNVGFDIARNITRMPGYLSFDLGPSYRILDFSQESSFTYNKVLFAYRLGYVLDLGNYQVGTFYSSLIKSSTLEGLGTIRANTFGVILRKPTGKHPQQHY